MFTERENREVFLDCFPNFLLFRFYLNGYEMASHNIQAEAYEATFDYFSFNTENIYVYCNG